uniref:Uncharacterized protein n=1 Tax=Peronospora matthiolae TaxID=2874970 RepID=A0AAV1TRX2_9STRA
MAIDEIWCDRSKDPEDAIVWEEAKPSTPLRWYVDDWWSSAPHTPNASTSVCVVGEGREPPRALAPPDAPSPALTNRYPPQPDDLYDPLPFLRLKESLTELSTLIVPAHW